MKQQFSSHDHKMKQQFLSHNHEMKWQFSLHNHEMKQQFSLHNDEKKLQNFVICSWNKTIISEISSINLRKIFEFRQLMAKVIAYF